MEPEEQKTNKSGVSIIIPAYNEEHGIGPVIEQLLIIMRNSGLENEIIVVDDGSTDNTSAEVAKIPDVRVIRHQVNKGYGAALKTGIKYARFENICITDADGTYPNDRIPGLIGQLVANNKDMVVGARTGKNVAIPLIRKPAKWVINCLANFVVGEPIPDLNSGLRVFRKDVAYRFFNILSDGYSFTTTITLSMLSNGYAVEYVPIDYHARVGKSKIKPIRDTLKFTQLVLRIALYFAPLKLFLPLSAFIFLTALGWGSVSYFVFDRLADVSTIVIAFAGFQVLVTGMLAELINRRTSSHFRHDSFGSDSRK